MHLVARWCVSTGPKKILNELVPLGGVNVGRQKGFSSGPHKMDSLGSHWSQNNVPPSLKGRISRLVPLELYKLLIFSLDFTNKEESLHTQRKTEAHPPFQTHIYPETTFPNDNFESCDLMVGSICHAKQNRKQVLKNNHSPM